jgi:TRAP-type transport system periplasmic protein
MKVSAVRMCSMATLVLAFVGSTGAANAATDHVDATIVIKMASTVATTHPSTVALQTVARIIDTKTHGQVQLQVYPNGQLGGQNDLLQALKTNTIQMYIQNPPVTSTLDPMIGVFGAPYLFNSPAAVVRAWKSRIGQSIVAHFDKTAGIKLLTPWRLGEWQIVTTSKPVHSCQDISGMKLRVPPGPVLAAFVQACGATPVAMSFGEVYLALKTGTIDGLPNPLPNVLASNLQQVAKDATVTNSLYDIFNPMINDQTWNALTPAQRKILVSAFGSGRLINDRLIQQSTDQAKTAIKQAGGQVITPTAAQNATWAAAGKKLWSKFAGDWGGLARVKSLAAAANLPGPNDDLSARIKAYRSYCRGESNKKVAGQKGTPLSLCVTAMAKLESSVTTSAKSACASLKKGKKSFYSICLAGGAKLIKSTQ